MGVLHVIVDIVVVLVTLAAWVSGSLDPYQKRLQEIALDTMGETKVSYGLKSALDPTSHTPMYSIRTRLKLANL